MQEEQLKGGFGDSLPPPECSAREYRAETVVPSTRKSCNYLHKSRFTEISGLLISFTNCNGLLVSSFCLGFKVRESFQTPCISQNQKKKLVFILGCRAGLKSNLGLSAKVIFLRVPTLRETRLLSKIYTHITLKILQAGNG